MGQWTKSVFLSGAEPRGIGFREAGTGLYDAKCIDSELIVASTGRPGTLIKLQIIGGEFAGIVLRQRFWDANAADSQKAKDGMTATYKATLIGLCHDEAQVNAIVDKETPMNQSHFEQRTCQVWVEHSNKAMGYDFPEVRVQTPAVAAEIKDGSRVPLLEHNKQNPKKRPIGAAPVDATLGGGGLGLGGSTAAVSAGLGDVSNNGAGNPLSRPPAQGGADAQLDGLLGK